MSDVSKYNVCLILFPFCFAICHPHFDKQNLFFFSSPRGVAAQFLQTLGWVFLFSEALSSGGRHLVQAAEASFFFFFFGFMCNVGSAALNRLQPTDFLVCCRCRRCFSCVSENEGDCLQRYGKALLPPQPLRLFIVYPPSHKCRGTFFFFFFLKNLDFVLMCSTHFVLLHGNDCLFLYLTTGRTECHQCRCM